MIAEDVEYTKRYQDTHIWLQKYRPYDKNFKQSSGDQNLNYNNNYRYYRYAETLLNAAELLFVQVEVVQVRLRHG